MTAAPALCFRSPDATAGRWSVMLVDDDPDCGDMMRTALRRSGIDVTLHTNSTAASEEFRRHPDAWDALVTDQVMPGMMGLDLVREVKALRADLPCIIYTGHANDMAPDDLRRSGLLAVLNKPVVIQQVVDALAGGITKSRIPEHPQPARSPCVAAGRPEASGQPAVTRCVGDTLCDIADSAPAGLFATDPRGCCTYANTRLLECLGRPLGEVIGQDWAVALGSDLEPGPTTSWNDAVRCGLEFRQEHRLRRIDGSELWLEVQAVPRRSAEGRLAGLVGVVIDVSDRHGDRERLDFVAHHDLLTGLPNRVLARDRLLQAISFAGRNQFRVALLLVDIDHFKDINDTLGHSIGDTVLTAVAERLEGCIRDSDTVSRLDGDEFLVIITDIEDTDSVGAVAAKILGRISKPLDIDGHELRCSASIGIGVHPDDGCEFDALLGKADIALDQAKTAGRNTFRFFAQQMNIGAVRQLKIRSHLHGALERGEFVLHYQPVVDMITRRVVGAEALIRWNHPERGRVPPDEFIPIAEDSGLIVAIGEWVLHEACRQAAAWKAAFMAPLFVAVNLSAVQFRHGGLENSVSQALSEHQLPPSLLELELTESILITDSDNTLAVVRRLRALGVRLSIDDFGTGYSSMAYLKHFAVHKVKIDKSFVAAAHKDSGDAAIVSAVVQMARAMNLETVAEGVEEPETLALLKALRCDLVQGYIYGRPVPADAFAEEVEVNLGQLSLPGFSGIPAGRRL